MVHKSYKIGIGFLLVVCIATGELFDAFAFCAEHSVTKTYIPMVLFATSGYIGVNFVLALVKEFGALTAVTGIAHADRPVRTRCDVDRVAILWASLPPTGPPCRIG